VGLSARIGIADKDTNPIYWTFSAGLSGRGSIPSRDNDTWGIGIFYNDVQGLDRPLITFNNTNGGVEVYYDIALFGWAHLTLDAQWVKSAFDSVENATILGGRLNVSF
jgi:porin